MDNVRVKYVNNSATQQKHIPLKRVFGSENVFREGKNIIVKGEGSSNLFIAPRDFEREEKLSSQRYEVKIEKGSKGIRKLVPISESKTKEDFHPKMNKEELDINLFMDQSCDQSDTSDNSISIDFSLLNERTSADLKEGLNTVKSKRMIPENVKRVIQHDLYFDECMKRGGFSHYIRSER